MVDLSALAFSVRKLCLAQGISVHLGQAQQLVVASFGYRTLASYQASKPTLSLDDVRHLVLDVELLRDRARAFGLDELAMGQNVEAVLEELLPAAGVHMNGDSFAQTIQEFVDDATWNDGEVTSQTAMTNGSLGEIYMPLDLWESLDLAVDDDIDEELFGHVSMEQDPERVYYGHKVVVEARLFIDRIDKRMFGEPQLRVHRAKLEWFGESDEDDREEDVPDGPPRIVPLAKALSEVLGIDEDDAELLDFNTNADVSDDGLVYGLVLEFGETATEEVAEKIRAKHPSMSVRVPPDFFDNVRRGADGDLF